VAVGDAIVVGPGEALPVDGRVTCDLAVLDESALTGESVHVRRYPGEEVRSGAINAGGAVEIRATATAEGSTYAAIVRLARQAAAENASSRVCRGRHGLVWWCAAVRRWRIWAAQRHW
jgi:P-type E1-E2 ATPase